MKESAPRRSGLQPVENDAMVTRKTLSLNVSTEIDFLPLCTSFAEEGALALGMDPAGATALTLATEEIFSFLCRISGPDRSLEIRCSTRHYYISIEISCPVEDFDMRLFNLSAAISLEDETSLDQMGLLIASRFVDRLQVKQGPERRLSLCLIKEKSYPEGGEDLPVPPKPSSRFSLKRPDPEVLKLLSMRIRAHYPPRQFPGSFRFPGKLADMVTGGEYEAMAALGPDGALLGGILWHELSKKTVEFFGPYLFSQEGDSSTGEALLEASIGAIAKSPTLGLVNLLPTAELPKAHFETLGTLHFFHATGERTSSTAFFRQMQEDLGTSSWCNPALESFLRAEYRRLELPREILPAGDRGEQRNRFSVLSTDLDRYQNRATLRPVRSGKDVDENVGAHLDLLRKESIGNVFFVMDLGDPRHTDFTPALLRHGFTPRMVIPYGGEGDQVLFQMDDGSP
jgi:hypothetical protein